jgi:hypothetical protein
MGWGFKNKEDEDKNLPEKLRGKTPEQIAAELADKEALQAKVAELEASNAASTSRFESFSTEMNGKFDQLMNKLTPPKRDESKNPDGTPKERPDFILSPDEAFNERAAPLTGLALNTAAVVARNLTLQKLQAKQRTVKGNIDGTLFERFSEDITKLSAGVPAIQLADPTTWEHLFFNVKGRKSDEIITSVREGKNDFFVEGTQTAVPTPDGTEMTLTKQELRICEKMGTDPAKYLEQKKKMQTGVPENFLA